MTTSAWYSNDGQVSFNANGASLTAKGYLRSRQEFKRPLRVEWIAKEKLDSNTAPECMVFQVFPTNNGRHSGYNFGVDGWRSRWWGSTDGKNVKPMQGNPASATADFVTQEHTYAMEVLADGTIKTFLDGDLKYEWKDSTYTEGSIGMGPSCRSSSVRSVKVINPGTYGLTTAACRANLRNLVSMDPLVAKRASYTSTFQGEAVGCQREGTGYVSKVSGFFKPTTTGSYTFSMAASEGALTLTSPISDLLTLREPPGSLASS